MANRDDILFEDPVEAFEGDYITAPDVSITVETKYNIRAFSRFLRETGREWETLTDEEKMEFLI